MTYVQYENSPPTLCVADVVGVPNIRQHRSAVYVGYIYHMMAE